MATRARCSFTLRDHPVTSRLERVLLSADTLTPAERSERMARIRSKDTGPEKRIRRLLTALGFRYRLQYSKLPGRPDIAFPGRKKVIWVHGCFWHRHPDCALARLPKSRLDFWKPKLEHNRTRDLRNQAQVQAAGWDALVVWECELSDEAAVAARLRSFLDGDSAVS